MATRRTLAEQVTGLDAPRDARRPAGQPGRPPVGRGMAQGARHRVGPGRVAAGVWSGWRADYVLPGLSRSSVNSGTGSTTASSSARWASPCAAPSWLQPRPARRRGARQPGDPKQDHAQRVGSMISGLQTMPSIAWFPLAILFFKRSEAAIMFVMVLGRLRPSPTAHRRHRPHPPLMLRAGRVLGARDLSLFRHVILPASLPSFVAA